MTDKTGLAEFAGALRDLEVELISTGGTARLLREAGIAVRDVAEVTGFPEMLGGRVKTMHPRITGGILAVRSDPDHMRALAEHNIAPIDLVVVNLYAFEKTAAKPGARFEEIIENIDIGGPTMIRSAAKNFADVAVVTDPADYAAIAGELRSSGGALSEGTRWRLAQKAFALTASYDRAISNTLATLRGGADSSPLPEVLDIREPRRMHLRYGENPHQQASLYAQGDAGIAGARQLHGKELSYNNLVDLDAAWQLVREFERPAAAIIKHTNPCGCAEQETQLAAYRKALACDPVSAFGGVLAFNRPLDGETAAAVAELFVEAIAAPGYAPEALERLQAKKNLRLIEVAEGGAALVVKSISGGYLAQTEDSISLDRAKLTVATERKPTPGEAAALEFGWKVAKHVKSNAIVFAVEGQTVGIGAGQMSRVDSVKLAASKAVLPLKGTVV
ncbi:MAG TPA: bifunctional phosphoribosylaminoimidazolecarboxamide formyltransferase/IMP cyclohydrolase, partial [Bryobacterales bacterium]|nr:bifunctional phosphoribosylaminoimidazolecarboxamide formyltransferase/IMP cyclohydrolase [Bryobacterales bacterium]